MIDIDTSLDAISRQKSFWVEFEVSGESNPPAFEVEVKQREQRRIVNRFIHATSQTDGAESERKVEITIDAYGLGLALAPYIIGWRGFAGTFDRTKATKWLEAFGQYAELLGQHFKSLLEKYENDLLKRQDAEEKN